MDDLIKRLTDAANPAQNSVDGLALAGWKFGPHLEAAYGSGGTIGETG